MEVNVREEGEREVFYGGGSGKGRGRFQVLGKWVFFFFFFGALNIIELNLIVINITVY